MKKAIVDVWDLSAGENSKCRRRRILDSFFDRYCFGKGVEVGDHDPLLPGIASWNPIGEKDNTYDFVYSNVLNEQDDPEESIKTWFKAVKPGGFLILYVPCRDLYEKKPSPPSLFNKSTKTFWLMEDSTDEGTKNLIRVIQSNLDRYQIVRAELCDHDYGSHGHQLPSWGEYSYEVVIRKLKPVLPESAYPLPNNVVSGVENSGNWTLMRYSDKWHAVFRVDENRIADNNLHLLYPAEGSKATLVHAVLDDAFKPVSQRPLIITPDLHCEDPRLFLYRGKLYMAYNGASYKPSSFRQHICDISSGQPGPVYALERCQPTDKNWMYFERDGNLYAVYSIDPHVVVRIDGDKIEEAGRSDHGLKRNIWWYGEPRGGSCPWYIGNDEFLTFFQSHYIPAGFYRRVYVMGAYVFSAKPPFEIKRITHKPLIAPESTDTTMHAVVFPGGAVFKDDKWVVPFGYNDVESRVAIFTREAVDSLMVKI